MPETRAALSFQRGTEFLVVPGFRQQEALAVARLIGAPQVLIAGATRCTLSAAAVWGAIAQGFTLDDLLRRVAEVAPDGVPASVQAWLATTVARANAVRLEQDVHGWRVVARDPTLLRRLGLHVAPGEYHAAIEDASALTDARLALARAGYPLVVPWSAKRRSYSARGVALALRDYQAQAVSALQRAGSGVVQLPCGAGKTRIGVALAQQTDGPVLILTPSRDIGSQWIDALRAAEESRPISASSADGEIVVATYSAAARGRIGEALRLRQWALVIFDEVHMLPATTFRVAAAIQAERRVGLTATLVREDGREIDIAALVGPPVYARTWRDLEADGWIAPATCVEVRLPYAADPAQRERFKRAMLARLLQRHEQDTVLVAASDLAVLHAAARALDLCIVTGSSSASERREAFAALASGALRVLGMSRIGSVGIDIPRASVMIQMHGVFGSRQEEAQRLGRLLRPQDGKHAHFYSLVSEGTREVTDAQRRQRFLVEQGYTYVIVPAREIARTALTDGNTT